jgi:hypothetical protein
LLNGVLQPNVINKNNSQRKLGRKVLKKEEEGLK